MYNLRAGYSTPRRKKKISCWLKTHCMIKGRKLHHIMSKLLKRYPSIANRMKISYKAYEKQPAETRKNERNRRIWDIIPRRTSARVTKLVSSQKRITGCQSRALTLRPIAFEKKGRGKDVGCSSSSSCRSARVVSRRRARWSVYRMTWSIQSCHP